MTEVIPNGYGGSLGCGLVESAQRTGGESLTAENVTPRIIDDMNHDREHDVTDETNLLDETSKFERDLNSVAPRVLQDSSPIHAQHSNKP